MTSVSPPENIAQQAELSAEVSQILGDALYSAGLFARLSLVDWLTDVAQAGKIIDSLNDIPMEVLEPLGLEHLGYVPWADDDPSPFDANVSGFDPGEPKKPDEDSDATPPFTYESDVDSRTPNDNQSKK